jgi:hypothetical protein
MLDEIIDTKVRILHTTLFDISLLHAMFVYFHDEGYRRGDFITTYMDSFDSLIDL